LLPQNFSLIQVNGFIKIHLVPNLELGIQLNLKKPTFVSIFENKSLKESQHQLRFSFFFQVESIVQQRDMYKSIAESGGDDVIIKTPTGPKVTSTPG
jgi:hypothetical protein